MAFSPGNAVGSASVKATMISRSPWSLTAPKQWFSRTARCRFSATTDRRTDQFDGILNLTRSEPTSSKSPSSTQDAQSIHKSTPPTYSSRPSSAISRQAFPGLRKSQGTTNEQVLDALAQDSKQYASSRASMRSGQGILSRPDDSRSSPEDRAQARAREMQRMIDENDKKEQERKVYRYWPRAFKTGQVYAPRDLSAREMRKNLPMNLRPRMRSVRHDVFDVLGINPRDEYKNFAMMSEFTTPLGRILPRSETGLRPVNQRRLAKAIKRAVGMALIPSVHRHPEILEAAQAEDLIRRRKGIPVKTFY